MIETRIKSGVLDLRIKDLPAIPALIADAIRVIEDLGTSGAEIEAVIMRDQVLTARILRVANSAAYGFTRRIETVRESVVLLGNRKLRSIAGAMISAGLFVKRVEGILDPPQLWAHSLATSVWAMEIIEYKRAWHAQSAVMAGLLHDIGMLLLFEYAPERYGAVLNACRREQQHHAIIEQRELGTTHARIGASLCAKWMLPVGLTALVNAHHANEPPTDDALGVVMLSDWLAHTRGHTCIPWGVAPELPNGLLENLALDMDDLSRLDQKRDQVCSRVAALIESAGE